MSAYDFIDESNPVRVIDVFVDALDLAEMSFEGVEPAATGRPSYHPSSVFLQEFPSSGIPCCEVTTTSSRLPALHEHTLIASVKYFAWPRIVVHR